MEEKRYNKKVLADLRTVFANSLYNQKINQNASNRLRRNSNLLFWVGTILLIVYLSSNLDDIKEINVVYTFIESPPFELLNGLSGVAGIVLTMIRYWGRFEHRSIRYEETAKQYRRVRDDLLSLMADYMSDTISDLEATQRRDSIKDDIDAIDQHALSTSQRDYNKAQKDLRGKSYKGEHFTFSNEEIDRHLPEEFKIAQKNK